jgi:hypothetical protein
MITLVVYNRTTGVFIYKKQSSFTQKDAKMANMDAGVPIKNDSKYFL